MENVSYFKQAWQSMSADKKWWKLLIIFSLVNLIPVVGPILVLGYELIWAREAAWGVDRPLQHAAGDIGETLKLGFFAFVIFFVWCVALSLIDAGLSSLPGFLGSLGELAGFVLLVGGMMVCSVAALRGAIYNSMTPGFQVKMAWEMSRHEWKGLGRVLLIVLVGSLIIGAVATAVLAPAVLAAIAVGSAGYFAGSSSSILLAILSVGPLLFLLVLAVWLVGTFANTVLSFVAFRALGCWMAQFKPATWGPSQQPLPFMVAPPVTPAAPPAPAPAPAPFVSATDNPSAEQSEQKPAAEEVPAIIDAGTSHDAGSHETGESDTGK